MLFFKNVYPLRVCFRLFLHLDCRYLVKKVPRALVSCSAHISVWATCWVNWKDWEPHKGRKSTKIVCVAASTLQVCKSVWFKLTGRHFLNAFHISLVSSKEPQLRDQGNASYLHQALPYLNGDSNPESITTIIWTVNCEELWFFARSSYAITEENGQSTRPGLHKNEAAFSS